MMTINDERAIRNESAEIIGWVRQGGGGAWETRSEGGTEWSASPVSDACETEEGAVYAFMFYHSGRIDG